MRIPTLRSLALAAILIIFDFRELLYAGEGGGFDALRYESFSGLLVIISGISCVGLVFVMVCSILLLDKAPSFTRPAVICAVMLFIEAIQMFRMAPDEILFWLLLFYLFLKALLILFVLEAVAQLARIQGHAETAVLAERIGLLYALTFPLRVGQIYLADFRGIFWLVGLCLAVLTSAALFYMHVKVLLPPETTVDEEEPPLDGEDGEDGENNESSENENEEAEEAGEPEEQEEPQDSPQDLPEAEEA